MNHYAVCALNQAEVFLALNDKSHRVFQVKYMRCIPIRNIVDVCLGGCNSHQISIANRHVNHPIFKVKIFSKFNVVRENICNLNTILVVEVGLPVVVGHLLIHNLSENYTSISTGSCTKSSVGRPN